MAWMQTISGNKFTLSSPASENVDFNDIAHALSHIPRFNGHMRKFYSVAEHCVRVAETMPQYHVYGLLHDAHEAYMGDIPTPIFHALGAEAAAAIQGLKQKLDAAIYAKAGLVVLWNHPALPLVHWADQRLLMTERRDLMAPSPASWGDRLELIEPLPDIIEPWSQQKAKTAWLDALDGYLSHQ